MARNPFGWFFRLAYGTVTRAALYVLGLARTRIARRPGPYALAALGLAAGAAVVAGVLGGTAVAQDRSVSQAIERIPDEQRSVRTVWFGVQSGSDDELPALERRARAARAWGDAPATRIVLFRESTIAGRFAGLGAVDGLAPHVVLESGRLPRACRPERCEVLRLRGDGAIPNGDGLRLVEVGEASLRSRELFGDFIAPTDNALEQAELAPAIREAVGYHRPPPPPLFLAEGVAGLAGSPQLDRTYRSYAWVQPLGPGRPRLWEIDRLAASVDRARAELNAASFAFDVTAPISELRAAQRSSRVAGRRLLLVGGEAAALLLAFAVLAAAALRRDLDGARHRLRLHGARRWQLGLLTGSETAVVALAGTALGWAAGIAAAAVAADRAGAPVGAVLRESVISWRGAAVALGSALAAWAVLAAAVSGIRRESGRVRVLDVLAVAAVAVVAVALWQGAADSSRLEDEEGTAALLLLLPALLAFAAAVAAARLLGPALRLLERLARGRLALRLAAVSLSRGRGTATIATAFLVVSFSLALLAEAYRATLAEGERDAAAFAVPLDFVVREDLRRLVPVQEAATLERFSELAPGVRAEPVLRLTGGAGRIEGVTGLTLLGLRPGTLPSLRGLDRGEQLAERIRPERAVDLQGVRVGSRLAVRASGGPVRLDASVLTPRGDVRTVRLGETGPAERTFRAAVPVPARGGLLVGIDLEPATRLQERGADAGIAQPVQVTLRGLPLGAWVGANGATLRGAGDEVSVRAVLSPQRTARIRPRQPTDGVPPPVVATSRLAAAAGAGELLPLQVGGTEVTVRVAGTVPRFPGVRGDAVVGDVDTLVSALTAARPGAARVNEVWLAAASDESADAAAAALARPPYAALQTVSRRELEADARRDPLAHGTLLTLLGASLVALGLAVTGLTLAVLADLRDERGELLDLEAEGASPSLLRRVVRLRAFVVAAFGLVAGAAAGVALAALVTDVVAVTARARAPEPPLELALDPLVVVLATMAYAALAGGLVVLATRRSFRGEAA
jgi:hypothetical protein